MPYFIIIVVERYAVDRDGISAVVIGIDADGERPAIPLVRLVLERLEFDVDGHGKEDDEPQRQRIGNRRLLIPKIPENCKTGH